ncbi:hypothetical protein DUNSADRAFT_13328 [Dunaliella salina]|uniref:Encoded protein n=1 Tax=Dunaliella salina TaxID=3046 RepID=A0ABQ7G9M2_DUNSA|nr:hypothetical protein DUNSADRAFT_13328 [Dunaliella salina]|eukprot:KAF5831299.1 hypothetical protein DUNSADRAFT_13328 [Dunaliella salina]
MKSPTTIPALAKPGYLAAQLTGMREGEIIKSQGTDKGVNTISRQRKCKCMIHTVKAHLESGAPFANANPRATTLFLLILTRENWLPPLQ